MNRLIVFDWDGTLADSIPNIIACKNAIALKYHLSVPNDETIKAVLGMPFPEAMSICFPAAPKALGVVLQEDYQALMKKEFYNSPLFPDAKSTLIALKSRGFTIGLATAKHKDELLIALKYHALQDCFDAIACGNEHPGKPDPAMLNTLIKQCGTSTSESVFIGDTTTDIKFAQNAGVKVIAVSYGAHNKEKLLLSKPDGLVDNLLQILLMV